MDEGSVPIQAQDLNGNPIEIGSYVIYINTGTAGQVIEIKQDEGTTWALLDTTGLYYNVLALVTTDEGAIKVKKERETGKIDIADLADQQTTATVADVGQVTGGG